MAKHRISKSLSYCDGRVQKFNDSFELLEHLPPRAVKILRVLGAGNNEVTAARAANCSKSNVTYWKDKLLAIGALHLLCRDVSQTFDLTPFGSKLLTMSEDGFCGEVFVLEDHAVKFEIVEREKVAVDWRKLGQPRNWQKVGIKIGNVRVEKTSRNVIIHPGKLKGFDIDELEVTAGQVVERMRAFLENRFGMVLSEEGIPLHKPIWQVFSPEAEEWAKAGTVKVNGIGQLDKSPPERKAYREYDKKQLAVDAVMAPAILASIEHKVEAIAENVGRLIGTVDKLTNVLGKLVQPESEKRPESEAPSYVR